MSPKITIIIPVLNNLSGLKNTITSILKQSLKNIEVFIIDGGSNKETQDYLKSLKSPFFYTSEKDNGVYDAMNKGISMSNGEWLFFLGAGDVFFDNTILQDIFNLKIDATISIISGKVLYVGDNQAFIYSKIKKVKRPSWSFLMWIRNGLHHQGTFYKKKLFNNVRFNVNYKILGDYWFNLMLYKQKEKCFLIDSFVANCLSNGLSKTGNWHMYSEEIKLKKELSKDFLGFVFFIIALSKWFLRKIISIF